LFADDTNIFITALSRQQVYEQANKVLNLVNRYMVANRLHINIGKSCYIEFSNTSQNKNDLEIPEQKISINGIVLQKVQEAKFLGVTIDENLNWNSHLAKLAKKLAACSGMLNRIKTYITHSSKAILPMV